MAIMKKIRKSVDNVRKKYIPTFGEQRSKAKSEGKKTFKSTRDDKKKGKLSYSTMSKEEVVKKIHKSKERSGRKPSDTRPAPKYEKATGTKVSTFGQAFAQARKDRKNSFTHNGKKYTTQLKGQLSNTNRIPELSGKTSKKIKKIVRGNNEGFGDVSARKGGLIQGFPRIAKRGY